MLKQYTLLGMLFFGLLSFEAIQAQTYYLGNGFSNGGTVNATSGKFRDSGGSSNYYSKNEDYTVTFAAPSGERMVLDFTYFYIENWYDRIYFYDGNSTSSPKLGNSYYTGYNSPGTLTATGRYITVRFKSDYIVQKPGWAADISTINDSGSGGGSSGSGSSDPCVCSNNLIYNGGFENYSSGWTYSPDAYYDFYSGYDDCGNRSTRIKRGSGSGLLDPAAYQQENNITPGATYNLKFDAATHYTQYMHRVYLRFYNSNGQMLAQDYREADHDVDWDGKLENYSISMQAPAYSSYARVEAVINGDWIKLDNVCLELASTPPPTCNLTASLSASESSCVPNDDIVQTNGQAVLSASSAGGSGVTYAWSNGLGSGLNKTVNPSSTTTYVVTATDNNNCTATATKTINVQTETPAIDLSIDQGDCITGVGSITINNLPSGYFSQIDGGAWTQTSVYNNLSVGQHTVRMGLSGCNSTAVADIQPSTTFTTTTTFTEHSCTPNDGIIESGDTVTISVIPTGSNASSIFKLRPTNVNKCLDIYDVSWSNNLYVQQYDCGSSASQNWTFTPVAGGTAITSMYEGRFYIQNASNGLYLAPENNGTVNGVKIVHTTTSDINAQWDVTYLGSGEYKINNAVSGIGMDVGGPTTNNGARLQLWGDGWGANQKFYIENENAYSYEWSNGNTGPSISVCPENAKNYSVTITNAQGCERHENIWIHIQTPMAEPQFSLTHPSCGGANVGTLDITNLPAGAYSRVDGSVWAFGKTNYENLSVGAHSVEFGYPNNDCSSSEDFNINNSSSVVYPILTATDVDCVQGAGTISITNRPSGYYTQLNGGNWTQTSTYNNLAAGTYTVCMGQNGCNDCATIVIQESNNLPLPQFTLNQPDCDENEGDLTLTNLPSGAASSVDGSSYVVGKTNYSNLSIGQHTICIGNANCNSCSVLDIQATTGFTTTTTFVEHSCTPNDGWISEGDTVAIVVTPIGNTASPVFRIKTKEDFECVQVKEDETDEGEKIKIDDCAGTENQGWLFIPVNSGTAVTTMSSGRYYIQNLENGMYFTPKDNDPSDGKKIVQTYNTSQYAQWDISYIGGGEYEIKNAVSAIHIKASGNKLKLDDDADVDERRFYIETSNAISYQWSNGSTDSTISVCPTSDKQYSVTVSNALGCSVQEYIWIRIQTPLDAPQFTLTQPACNENTGSLTITNLPNSASSSVDGSAWVLGKTNYTNLSIGTHNVEFGYPNDNCNADADFIINASQSSIYPQLSATNTDCGQALGSISVNNLPYGFYSQINGGNWTQTANYDNLAAGTYTVCMGQNGCNDCATIVIQNNNVPSPQFTLTQPNCGETVGTLSISNLPTGYSSRLDGGAWNFGKTSYDNVAVGNHNLEVGMPNTTACTALAALTINAAPALVQPILTAQNADCVQGSGTISISNLPSGYSSQINNGAWSQTAQYDNLAAGTYTVCIGLNGCTECTTIDVELDNSVATPQFTLTQPTCDVATGSMTITNVPNGYSTRVDGGAWAFEKANYDNLATGTHTVEFGIPNAATCTASTTLTIDAAPTALQPQLTATDADCIQGIGSISITNMPNGYKAQINGGYWYNTSSFNAVPAGDHEVCIIEDGNNGCIACATITVDSPEPIETPIISAINDTLCAGNGTVLTAVLSGNNAGCTVQWQKRYGYWWININNATGLTYTTPVLNTTSDYRAVLSCSTSSCLPMASATQRIVVFAEPQASIVGNNVSICEGGDATLTADVQGGVGQAIYQWQESIDGAIYHDIVGATAQNYATGPLSNSRSYRVVVGFMGAQCSPTTSAEATILVNPDPAVTVTGDFYNCPGEEIELEAIATGGAGNCNYQWQRKNNNFWMDLSGEDDDELEINNQASNEYRVRYFCTGSGCDAAVSNPHTVNEDIVNLSMTIDDDTICSGNSTVLHVSVSNGNLSCVRFQKSPDGHHQWQDIGTAGSGSLNTPALTTKTYYRAVYECQGSSCPPIKSSKVKIEVIADPSAGIVGGDVAVCEGGIVTLNAAATGGAGQISYQWQESADGIIYTDIFGETNQSFSTPSMMQTTHYQVVIDYSGFQCSSNIAAGAKITVYPDPTISVAGADTACFACPINLQATYAGGAGNCILKWQYKFGEYWLDIPFANADSLTVPLFGTTTFRAFKKCFAGGCGEAYSEEKTVYLQNTNEGFVQPEFDIQFNANRQENACQLYWTTALAEYGDKFIVERSLNDGLSWERIMEKDANGTVGELEYFREYDDNIEGGLHIYRIYLEKKDGQSALSEERSVYFPDAAQINVFPNPNMSDKVTVALPEYLHGEACTIQISNQFGMIMQKTELNSEETKSFVEMDISTLRTGMYSVQIQAEKHRWVAKMLQVIKE